MEGEVSRFIQFFNDHAAIASVCGTDDNMRLVGVREVNVVRNPVESYTFGEDETCE